MMGLYSLCQSMNTQITNVTDVLIRNDAFALSIHTQKKVTERPVHSMVHWCIFDNLAIDKTIIFIT